MSATNEDPEAPRVVKKWAGIAKLLNVSEDAAQDYAARNVDPLPVFYDLQDVPSLYVSAAQDWLNRQSVFHRIYYNLRKYGLLPRQSGKVQADGNNKPRRRTKVAARAPR